MGAKGRQVRVVLDTNVVVSALLHGGPTARFQTLWRRGILVPWVSQEMLDEYVRVLNYPKFGYSPELVVEVLNEALFPWLRRAKPWQGRLAHPPKDKDDERFLRAALGANAEALVSGDPHLTSLDGKYPFPIQTPRAFLERGLFRQDGSIGETRAVFGTKPRKRSSRKTRRVVAKRTS